MDDSVASEKKEERLKRWLNDNKNLTILGVVIAATIIRLYYFFITKNQPLWWDEASYGSLAKNFISHQWDAADVIIGETKIRPPFFPFLWSIVMRLGVSEVGARFLFEFIPSVLSVIFVYMIVKEFYSKRTAIIASVIFSVLWIHLFYTARLLTDVLVLPFIFASIYYFIKADKDEFNPRYFALSIFVLAFGTLIRYPSGLVFLAYPISLLITRGRSIVLNRSFWLSGIVGGTPILAFFALNYVRTRNIFPALLSKDYAQAVSKEINFSILNFISVYLTKIFFVFFLIGALVVLVELILGFDVIGKNKRLKGHLLLTLAMIIIYGYFIFYIKGAEDRWLLPVSLSMVTFSALGLDYLYVKGERYSKPFVTIVIIAILSVGIYSELTFADSLIKDRKQTFIHAQQGFEWLKANTPPGTKIMGTGYEVYGIYYSERDYRSFTENESDIMAFNPEYLVIYITQNTLPPYLNDYIQRNQKNLQPVHVLFYDQEQKQPAFIVYKVLVN